MSSSNTLFVIGYLFAGDARVAVGGGAEDEVVEDGGVGRDADAAADHDGHLELVPVLVAAPERSLKNEPGFSGVHRILLLSPLLSFHAHIKGEIKHS